MGEFDTLGLQQPSRYHTITVTLCFDSLRIFGFLVYATHIVVITKIFLVLKGIYAESAGVFFTFLLVDEVEIMLIILL